MPRHQDPARSVHDAPTAPGSDGALAVANAASATRLRQANEDTAVGREAIAKSLQSTLAHQDVYEVEVPSRLSFASLIPELTRTTSFKPLADRLEPEDRRDVYRVVRKLGVGGMATVYEAVKEGTDGFRKRVALKRIHDHLAEDDRIVELLADEARLASLINHPHVCQVLDFGVDSSGYFMALEYLDGFTLRDIFLVLQEQPERVKEPRYQRIVARIIAGLAEGLHAAHELSDENGISLEVVHRDVSPHNLFVLRSGAVKVADFGVARARNQLHHTATGVLKGKLAYSSPEQLHRSQLDRQTDVFALGVCMWEMLTGQRLFDAESESQVIVKICGEAAPDVRARQTGIAPSIAAIVRRALAPDTAQRFKTGREMASAIERALSVQGDSVPVTDVSDWLFGLMGAPREPHRPELDRLMAETASAGTAPAPATSGAQKVARRMPSGTGPSAPYVLPPVPVPSQRGPLSTQGRVAPSSVKLQAAPAAPPVDDEDLSDELPTRIADLPSGGIPVAATPAATYEALSVPPAPPALAAKVAEPSTRSLGVIAGAALALALLCGGAWLALRKAQPAAPPTVTKPVTAVAAAPQPKPVVNTPVAAAPKVEEPVTEPQHAEPAPAPQARAATKVAAPKASASAAPPPSEFHPQVGTVLITSNGAGAEVLVDGRSYGPAPQRVTLPPGVHQVSLSIPGRGTSSPTPIQVDAGVSSFISLSVPAARD